MKTDYAPGEITRSNVMQAWWAGLGTGLVAGVMAISMFLAFTQGY